MRIPGFTGSTARAIDGPSPRRTLLVVAILFTLAGLAAPSGATAAWLPGGTPICTLPGVQTAPSLAPDGAGGAYFVWRDAAQGNDLFLSRVGPDGAPAAGWPAQGRRVALTPGARSFATIGADGAGGVGVAWYDGSVPRGIRLDSSGAATAGWSADGNPLPTYAPDPNAYGHAVRADGLGGFWVTFARWSSICPDVCYYSSTHALARVTPTGGDGGTTSLVNSSAATGTQVTPTPVESGQILLTLSAAEYGFSVIAQRRSAVTTTLWAMDYVQMQPTSSDGAGGAYMVSWLDPVDRVLRVNDSGVAAPGWPSGGVPVRSGSVDTRDLRALNDGSAGALAFWWESDPAGTVLRVQRLLATGALAPGWPADGVVVCAAPGTREGRMLPDGTGGAYFAWTDRRTDPDGDLYAHRVLASGTMDPGFAADGTLIAGGAGRQVLGDLVAVASGEAVVGWVDERAGAANADVYAQRLPLDAAVPALASLASLSATPECVRMEWQVDAGPATDVRLDRRRASAPWLEVATLAVDGLGRATFEDRDVLAGERLEYAIRFGGAPGEGHVATAFADVPLRPGFALAGFAPNPSPATATLSFALPDGAGARSLEVLDLQGRRVESVDVARLGAGAHRVTLGGEGLAPGLYVIRLRVGERAIARTGLVLR